MKTKLLVTLSLFLLSITPKILYILSYNYLLIYTVSYQSINRKIETVFKAFNLQKIPEEKNLETVIASISKQYKISPHFISALIKHESSDIPHAYSPKGAIGLMQIMPANAKRCGLSSPSQLWNEETNIRCGTQIISEEISTYKGDIYKALLAYNGGPKAVTGNYPESLNHAKEVLRLYAMASVPHTSSKAPQ